MNSNCSQFFIRALDIVGASVLLILFAPLLAISVLCVMLEDGTPLLYRQRRIGKGGRPFMILKIRSMQAGSAGATVTASGDRRVTKTGAWLRRLKVDELPQLFNVLRGDMSLIGPRPEVPEYVALQEEVWRKVLEVRPGITDLASLAFRDEEAILGPCSDPETYYRIVILPEKLRLNLWYQRTRSLALDLKLLWLTARYSFFPHGFSRGRVLRSLGC
jgi:lipopolysaccharide/colanic/teichoic acid biosynthesis glycosyltransferase